MGVQRGTPPVIVRQTHTSLAKYDVTGCLCAELWTDAMITGLNDSLAPRELGGRGGAGGGTRGREEEENYTVSLASEKWCWNGQGFLPSNAWRVIINPADVTLCFSLVHVQSFRSAFLLDGSRTIKRKELNIKNKSRPHWRFMVIPHFISLSPFFFL